jgi:molecular chaperone GrpE
MTHKHNTPASSEPAPAPVADTAPAAPTTTPVATPASAPAAPAEIDQLKTQVAENWDKFLRATADLENYRKRVAREKEELARATSERVVAALLPVLDNFERAIVAADQHQTDNAGLIEGVKQIQTQFRRVLQEFGLEEVIAHAGKPFDPNLHEAVSHLETAEQPEGMIVNQLQRGYRLAARLLRPVRVIVSKGAPPKSKP